MLTALRNADGVKVLARDSERNQAPFGCPGCGRVVTLKKGNIKVHHFAHLPPVTCVLGRGESEMHFRAKLDIYDALARESNVSDLELEKALGTARADVYAVISGTRVAIEIQRSTLTVNDITTRTLNYHRQGIAVLWLALSSPRLQEERFSPNAWEKWCHAAYGGRVYYWTKGQEIQPYHFDDYMRWVAESSWFEDGAEQTAGGYEKRSKRWRTLRKGVPTLISSSFRMQQRSSFTGGTVHVPECTLYGDIQPAWWQPKLKPGVRGSLRRSL